MFSNVAALALHLIISMAASNQVEVIVVGAGTSGISAARYLQDNTNYKVVIVEANDRTGGRINTVYHEGEQKAG